MIFLKKPVWAIVAMLPIAFAGWMCFEFTNYVGVAGIDYNYIGYSGLFIFLFQTFFKFIPFESFFGFFAEGPVLLPFALGCLVFIVYRLVDVSFSKQTPALSGMKKSDQLASLASFVVFEMMIALVFVAVFLCAAIILSIIANVAFGLNLIHAMIVLVIITPVFQLIVVVLKQIIRNSIVAFCVSFSAFGIFLVLDVLSYYPDQQGIFPVFGIIHLVLQWISPAHYGIAGIVGASFGAFIINVLFLVILGSVFGATGMLVAGRKGVK